MKNYNVEELSKMLNTNPETVRRWIRTGKLRATQNSKKEGNIITNAALIEFLNVMPKYASVAIKNMPTSSSSFILPLGLGTLVGGAMALIEVKRNQKGQITKENVIEFLDNLIAQEKNDKEKIQKKLAKTEKVMEQYKKDIEKFDDEMIELNKIKEIVLASESGGDKDEHEQ